MCLWHAPVQKTKLPPKTIAPPENPPSLSLSAKHSNSASGYKNERISLFDLTFLPHELFLHKHHVFLASSSSENQKDVEFSKCRFFRKKGGPSPMKNVTFC
jgi:hypothetical protein